MRTSSVLLKLEMSENATPWYTRVPNIADDPSRGGIKILSLQGVERRDASVELADIFTMFAECSVKGGLRNGKERVPKRKMCDHSTVQVTTAQAAEDPIHLHWSICPWIQTFPLSPLEKEKKQLQSFNSSAFPVHPKGAAVDTCQVSVIGD